ncbi:MAG: tetratricopeptide repeat protein [Polyangiales bacterium]
MASRTLLLLTAGLLGAIAAGCSTQPDPQTAKAHDPTILKGMAQSCVETSEPEACRAACDGGLFASCSDLGHLYELGLNVPRDVVAASSYYRKGCDGGDMAGCFNAAYVLENGIAGRRDPHCAVALYNYACDGGFIRGCLVAGFMYKSGVDITKDVARAALFFKKACDSGNVSGCNQLKELAPTPAQ